MLVLSSTKIEEISDPGWSEKGAIFQNKSSGKLFMITIIRRVMITSGTRRLRALHFAFLRSCWLI